MDHFSLTNSESFQDFEGINELRHDVHSALKRYENRDTDHDSFATETAQSYARFAAVSTTRALEQAASAYVHLELKSTLFAFAKPLVELLRNHDVAPILVTGAPLELGRQIAAELEIEEVHAVEVADGRIVRNTSTAKGKREVVADVARASRSIELAAGDSVVRSSLMAYASITLATQELVAVAPTLNNENTYQFGPETNLDDLQPWLVARLPAPNYPRIS